MKERSGELMRMSDHLEDMLQYFNKAWTEFEGDFFDTLLQSGYRPRMVMLEGKQKHYFLIDYEHRKLIKREKPHLILEIEQLESFGKLIGGEGTEGADAETTGDENKEGNDNGKRDSNYDVE